MKRYFIYCIFPLFLSSCSALRGAPFGYVGKAVVEKGANDYTKEKLSPILEQLKTIAASQRFMMEDFSVMRAEVGHFKEGLFQSVKESDKKHRQWAEQFEKFEKQFSHIYKQIDKAHQEWAKKFLKFEAEFALVHEEILTLGKNN